MEQCNLTTEGVKQLSKLKLQNLRTLALSKEHAKIDNNAIGDEGVQHLKKLKDTLSELFLVNCGIRVEGVKILE